MTQAFNLSQLANNLNTSGQLDATDGLTGVVPTSNLPTIPADKGGTGITSAGTAGNVLTSNGTTWVSQAASAGFSGATINAPSASALTLTNTSAQCQIVQFTSVANSVITLPNATTLLYKGTPVYRLINDSQCNANVFVKNASGTTLSVISIKGIVDVTLEDNSTSAGTWTFSTVTNTPLPAFYDSASVTGTTVPLGLTPLGGVSLGYAIQVSDTSYIFAILRTDSSTFNTVLVAVGATLSGSTFSFGTTTSVSLGVQRDDWRLCGFRLNSTTAIFDCRLSYNNGSDSFGRALSVVATISGNSVTLGSSNQNNTPNTGSPIAAGSGHFVTFWGAVKCRISDTAFATVYQTSDIDNNNQYYLSGAGNLACTITTVSGTTQTNGTQATIVANNGLPMGICSHTNNGFVVSYYTQSSSGASTGIRKAVAASVSGTVPTFGTPISIDTTNISVYKEAFGSIPSFNAVAFSSTKVFLPFYVLVAGESTLEACAYFGVCTVSGNTLTFVANSIIKVQEAFTYGEYAFEFNDSSTITQYTKSRVNIYKYKLSASDIPYLSEIYTLRSDLQSQGDYPQTGTFYALNYTQGTSVAVAYNNNGLYSCSNFTLNTAKVTAP
jgi:hypothetical protein